MSEYTFDRYSIAILNAWPELRNIYWFFFQLFICFACCFSFLDKILDAFDTRLAVPEVPSRIGSFKKKNQPDG